jgi:UDP-3-O-acyl N-acetylglucosamine deacetylase
MPLSGVSRFSRSLSPTSGFAVTEPQRTIGRVVERTGVGVNLGRTVTVRLRPAPPEAGLSFVRMDLAGSPSILVAPAAVAREPRRTILRAGKAEVQMTEHLLATVAGFEVDNLAIEVSGPELPVGDGSALLFAEMVQEAGVVEQDRPRPRAALREPIRIAEGAATLEAVPAEDGLTLSYTLEYPNTPLARQAFELRITPESFARELAAARTFVFEQEAPRLIARGFGRGANPENTLVVRADGSLLWGRLRFPEEFARHKMVDLLGDLRLAGGGLLARIRAVRSGHAHNLRLAEQVFAQIKKSEEDLTQSPF